jgi:hypothetical protein
MTNGNKISLQINLSAADLPICRKLLDRQIRFWYEELDEIVLSIESKKSFGKFAKDFDRNKKGLMVMVEQYITSFPKIRYHFIDYSPQRNASLAELFFCNERIPEKDYRGCAFYSYLDGLASCSNRYIIHLDSDIMLGGHPNSWLQDAVDLLNSEPSYLLINPLPGPPAANFELKQKYIRKAGLYQFLFNKMSTRVFLIDMEKLSANKLSLKKAPVTPRYIKWFFKSGFKWGYLALEDILSDIMVRRSLLRVDTLGINERRSAYTLHPVLKPAQYIQAIPDLLERMDTGDIPESQRGYYNVHNDFFDFSKTK